MTVNHSAALAIETAQRLHDVYGIAVPVSGDTMTEPTA